MEPGPVCPKEPLFSFSGREEQATKMGEQNHASLHRDHLWEDLESHPPLQGGVLCTRHLSILPAQLSFAASVVAS
jgi:hypothetical protein